MAHKLAEFQIKGMNQDLSPSKFNPEFAYKNMNLRLYPSGDNTFLSLINEKGTSNITIYEEDTKEELSLEGTTIGKAVIGDYIILFNYISRESIPVTYPNYIYRLHTTEDKSKIIGTILYKGDLNFNGNYPIETLVSYENENIQKVYWVDGINQSRFINVVESKEKRNSWNSTTFDFVGTLSKGLKDEEVTIKRDSNSNGLFAPGTIQYVFTYYNKFGKETNIFYISDLKYISFEDRGASPEEKVNNVFKISISNCNKDYDFIRVYSIHRTSTNATPEVKRVADITPEDNIYENIIVKEDIRIDSPNNIKLEKQDGSIVKLSSLQEISSGAYAISLIDYKTVKYNNGDYVDLTAINSSEYFLIIKEGDKIISSTKERTSFKLSKYYGRRASLIDDGTIGEIIDPTKLFYLGGELLYPYCISQKDNTLFLGNIKTEKYTFTKEEIEEIRKATEIKFVLKNIDTIEGEGNYIYHNQLSLSSNIKGFKGGEYYKVALQFQDKYGKYSDPVFIKLVQNTIYPSIETIEIGNKEYKGIIKVPKIKINFNPGPLISSTLARYNKVRVLIDDNPFDKSVICQGVLNPTLYNLKDLDKNLPHNIASWFFRPMSTESYVCEWRHNYPLPGCYNTNCEIQSVVKPTKPYIKAGENIEKKLTFEFYHYLKTNNNYPTFACNVDEDDYHIEQSYVDDYGNEARKRSYNHLSEIIKRDYGFNPGIPSMENWVSAPSYAPIIKEVTSSKKNEDIKYKFISNYSNNYYIDQSVITLNSPDLESSTNIIESSNLKLRIVGIVEPSAVLSNYTVLTDTTVKDPECEGVIKFNTDVSNISNKAKGLISAPLWNDAIVAKNKNEGKELLVKSLFVLYPWHRKNSLVNDVADNTKENSVAAALLKKKIFSNLKFCYNTKYFTKFEEMWSPKDGISKVSIFNSNELKNIKVGKPKNSTFENDYNYYGNVDTSVIASKENYDERKGPDDPEEYPGYPLMGIGNFPDNNYGPVVNNEYKALNEITTVEPRAINYQVKDPISIKFKSTPHGIFSFNYTDKGEQVILPSIAGFDEFQNYDIKDTTYPTNSSNGIFPFSNYPFPTRMVGYILASERPETSTTLKEGDVYFLSNEINSNIGQFNKVSNVDPITHKVDYVTFQPNIGTTWVYKDPKINKDIICKLTEVKDGEVKLEKGISSIHQDIISNNKTNHPYLYLAELYKDINSTTITEDAIKNISWIPASKNTNLTSNTVIENTEGDTYFQRWDCLKTYSYSQEDVNNVVEILSFMCESKYNIDGRYDKNRGQKNNLVMSPTNFNLYNSGYNQSNNFFNYRILDNRFNITDYNNTITWSLPKMNVDLIDKWTQITMVASLNLDGNKGPLNALRRVNNDILAFQDTGISQILYNENVQINSTNGVPIEIANSGKVQGKRYLSSEIGCTNKWSICNSANAVYFIDSIARNIYKCNTQGIENVSDKAGFHTWCYNNCNILKPWNPIEFNNIVSYYNPIDKEILFINKDECLVYSESLGVFTSFYSYEETPYFINLQDRNFLLKGNKLWGYHEGEYNKFFNEYKPFYTEVIANPDMTKDKIFDVVEFRADSFEGDKLTENTFDNLEVHNEYQRGKTELTNTTNKPSTLKKKFRIWRATIPRDNLNPEIKNRRDRMRNPWLYIKLSKENSNTEKTVLHDITVHYFD